MYALFLSLLTLAGFSSLQLACAFKLTILHVNDGESEVLPNGDFGGADRLVALVRELEKEGIGRVIKVTSGDNFLAGPEFSAALENGLPLYDGLVYRRMKFDAICLGNHDFDFGPDVTADFINSVQNSVFLSANLDFSQEPVLDALTSGKKPLLAKSTVVKKQGVEIGIVGATTENLNFVSSPRDVVVLDALSNVQAEIDMLTAQGVDIIILISHLQGIAEDQALISQLSGVDVAIAGGGSELLANPGDLLVPDDEGAEPKVFGPYPLIVNNTDGNPVPVVTTTGDYKYVGKLVLEFDKDGDLVGVVTEESGPVRVAGGAQPDAVKKPDAFTTNNVVEPVEAAVRTLGEQVIGTTEVALDGLRVNIRTQETNLGNLVADSFLYTANQLASDFGVGNADVALGNGGGIRNNNIIPVGDLTALDTFNILPFGNFITIIEDVPCDRFKLVMENAVSAVEDTGGRFAQIGGFSMTYNSSAQALKLDGLNVLTEGLRVQSIEVNGGTSVVQNGAVVAECVPLNLAIVDFLARGGDEYPLSDFPITLLGVTYQQALQNYIVNGLAGAVVPAAKYPVGGEGRIIDIA